LIFSFPASLIFTFARHFGSSFSIVRSLARDSAPLASASSSSLPAILEALYCYLGFFFSKTVLWMQSFRFDRNLSAPSQLGVSHH
jgi:hypothetical protein